MKRRKTAKWRQYRRLFHVTAAIAVIFAIILIIAAIYQSSQELVSPLTDDDSKLRGFGALSVQKVEAREIQVPVNYDCETERCEIVMYIAQVFEERSHEAIEMLASCENGHLDPLAENHNNNGTIDRGIFQINSIHGGEEMFDWKTNIDKAYEIYSNHDNTFYAWTCGDRVGDYTYLNKLRGE